MGEVAGGGGDGLIEGCEFAADEGDAGADTVLQREGDADLVGVDHDDLRVRAGLRDAAGDGVGGGGADVVGELFRDGGGRREERAWWKCYGAEFLRSSRRVVGADGGFQAIDGVGDAVLQAAGLAPGGGVGAAGWFGEFCADVCLEA